MRLIQSAQKDDAELNKRLKIEIHAAHFGTVTIDDCTVHTYKDKVWVPAELQLRIIEWYHLNLQHAGVTRTVNTIVQIFGWPGLHRQVQTHIASLVTSVSDSRQPTTTSARTESDL